MGTHRQSPYSAMEYERFYYVSCAELASDITVGDLPRPMVVVCKVCALHYRGMPQVGVSLLMDIATPLIITAGPARLGCFIWIFQTLKTLLASTMYKIAVTLQQMLLISNIS